MKHQSTNLLLDLKAKWEKYLTKKEVMKILQACNIDIQQVLEIKSKQIVNSKEFAVNVHVKILSGDKMSEDNIVLFSFRLGPPTWDQFIRTTYRSGSNIGIRIIIHEGNGFDRDCLNDPAGDLTCIGQLVDNNNSCGLTTYLIEAKDLIEYISEGKAQQIEYSYKTGPTVHENPSGPLPTIRQIQESEFWTCYYLPAWGMYPDTPMGLNGYRDEWAQVYRDLSLPVVWNDVGLHLNIIGDPDSELIKTIWKNRLGELKKGYPGSSIQLIKESDKPFGISIRISDIPMSSLIKMGPRKKTEYAEFIHDAEHAFMHFIDDILVSLKGKGKLSE